MSTLPLRILANPSEQLHGRNCQDTLSSTVLTPLTPVSSMTVQKTSQGKP